MDSNTWISDGSLGRDGMHLNRRGVSELGALFSRVAASKTDIVNKLIKFWNLVEVVNPDVIVGTKAWIKEEINYAEIFEPQFKVFRRDRDSSTRGGGIFVCVKT
ncbi:hypothetical protein C0J52_18504 [Blattella germanica]|nr:hypothetical protein C0J52_18504 [Blattella germanica]